MDIRKVSDDFFTIGNIAVLQRITGNDVYDFNFRNFKLPKSEDVTTNLGDLLKGLKLD